MRGGIGCRGTQLGETLFAHSGISFFQPLFVGDRLLLHEFDIERSPPPVVQVELALSSFAFPDSREALCQFNAVVNTAIQAEPADRIVDVSCVAREQHASLSERAGDAL